MYISRLQLKNWKNFRSADAWLRPRMFVIGPNASGKSNLFDALRFLRDVSQHGLRDSVDKTRGGVSAIRCLAAKGPSDIEIEVTLADDDARPLWRYVLTFTQDSAKRPVIKRECVEDLSSREMLLERPDENDKRDDLRRTQTALEQIVANQDFRQIADFFSQIAYQHILPQVVRDPTEFSPRQVQNDPYGRDFVARLWETPIRTRKAWLDRIVRVLQVAVPQLSELEVAVDNPGTPPHLVVRYEHWRHHPAKQSEAQLSDGTLRLLGLLWATFDGEGPLLLEEPELSLHAELVRHLPEMFGQIQQEIRKMRKRRAAGRRQLLVSTHSTELLSNPGIAAEEVLRLKPSPEGTKVLGASPSDKELFQQGLTAADVLLPQAAPSTDQLLFSFAR